MRERGGGGRERERERGGESEGEGEREREREREQHQDLGPVQQGAGQTHQLPLTHAVHSKAHSNMLP